MDPTSPLSPGLPSPALTSPSFSPTMLIDLFPQLADALSPQLNVQKHADATLQGTATLLSPIPFTFAPNSATGGGPQQTQSIPSSSQQHFQISSVTPVFVRTPERAYFQSRDPPASRDGRQSRLAMRLAAAERGGMALPLRVNTGNSYIESTIEIGTSTITAESPHLPSLKSSTPETWTRPTGSPSTMVSARRLVRPQVPAPVSVRSPIHKRPRLRSSSAPKYYLVVRESNPQRGSTLSLRARLEYMQSVEHLRAPLVPLISVTSGLSHPLFPTSLLQYHLLTHDQLDSLARWYHQVEPPIDETFMYPAWIPAWTGPPADSYASRIILGCRDGRAPVEVDLETKRRRFGRFIGLRGCESPTATGPDGERPEELTSRMEREWRRALQRAEEEERMWEKSWRSRW